MTISNIFMRAAILALICGVCLGMWMGHSQDFTLKSVHAHINLLGWVSMMIFGFFYRLFPAAATGWAPRIHLTLWLVGFVGMVTGLTGLMLGQMMLLPALLAGQVMVFVAILVFLVILFRATGGRSPAAAA